MDFPNEIVFSILSYLARPDLKSTRLVSKRWSLCAVEYFFDIIYISPSKEDVDVFQAITQHPVLSRCPRRLEYVGNEFLSDYPKNKYARNLWERTREQMNAYSKASGKQWLDPDAKINAWINETVLPNANSRYENIVGFYNSRVVNDAYLKYREHAKYQQIVLDGLQSSQLVEILVQGLQHLTSLASVTLHPDWPWKQKQDCQDGKSRFPLARSWHMFYPRPRRCGYRRQTPNGARHYLIISSALVRAQKRIRKFNVGRIQMTVGLTPNVFDSSVHSNTGLEFAAFSGLEHCDIALPFHGGRYRYKALNVHDLQLLLTSMNQLRFLSLSLPYSNGWDQSLHPSEMVFSTVKIWSKLTTLKLKVVCTTATDLLQLLIFQMPELRHLELGGINLVKGTWHSVIEGLEQSNRLWTFQSCTRAGLVGCLNTSKGQCSCATVRVSKSCQKLHYSWRPSPVHFTQRDE